jgi:short-subunit dehydrogenase
MGFPRHSGYAASKHALHGFLSTLAIENKKDITVLEAILGWIRDTNLRGNAFGPDGKKQETPPRKHSKESIALDRCVQKIIRAIKKDWRTAYIPLKLRLIPFFKAFWRWYLEFRANRVMEKPRQK